jgi:transposase-like protein
MNAKSPTLRQFLDQFPTEELCLDHIMRQRFGIEHECGSCGRLAKFYRVKARRSYACQWCGFQVFPTSGTPFDRTRTPLRDWFTVMFMFTTTRNGVAAKRVQRELGVTYKTAWRMCHQIRAYMASLDSDDPLGGPGEIVQLDETIVGGRVYGMPHDRRMDNKAVVLGMLEKGGELITRVVPDRRRATLWPQICENVLPGTILHSDELASYRSLSLRGYRHQTVSHKNKEYVSKSGVTVNNLEGFWSMLKRGIGGTHIHVSAKHLPKYLGEFEYRWNMRAVPHLMLDRLMHSFAR